MYEIQNHALSAHLPLASRHLYDVFKSASPTIQAQYLLGCYLRDRPTHRAVYSYMLSTVLRYPLCTPVVLEALLRTPGCPPAPPAGSLEWECAFIDLPRRLFRTLEPRPVWHDTDEPLPLLRFLYDHPRIPAPNANAHDGYALTRAVFALFVPLVKFLLDHEADPAKKNALAVTVAIRRKDVALVRMLIERDAPGCDTEKTSTSRKGPLARLAEKERARGRVEDKKGYGRQETKPNERSQKRESSSSSAKRRKLGDRLLVDQNMLQVAVKSDARDIIDYFMKEKGCVPNIQTMNLLRT